MNARNLALILVSSLAICATPAGAQMYWGYRCTDEVCGDGTGGIQRANLDGTGVETLVTGLGRVPCIALDVADGKMYWSTFFIPPDNIVEPIGMIQRANLDGTNVEDLVSLSVPFQTGLVLDVGARKIYWAEARVDAIQRANLDGSDVENVIVFQNRVFADPYGIALNRTDGKLYWTDFARDAVLRISLDGSGPEEVLITDLQPQDIALDSVAGKMYVADSGNSRILRANLDGSDVETVVQGGSPIGVALNLPTGKIYWTSYHDGRILRANFDGSDVEALVGGIPTVEAITLANTCGNGIVESPEACDDGNIANGDCCSSTCQYESSGSPCPADADVCTDDVCDGIGACGVFNTEPCDDGDACTQTDTCQAGACIGANHLTCTASDQCHDAGTCDTTTGVCSNPAKPDGSTCSDSDACTQTDTCQAGTCTGANLSWSGVLEPVNADGSSIFQLGRTVPIKFRLTGACAGTPDVVAKIFLAKISDQIVGSELEAASTSAADTGNTFRYDATADQYIYNLSTKVLSAGTWQMRVDLGDGVSNRTVQISIK